jgi:hypothetical protein
MWERPAGRKISKQRAPHGFLLNRSGEASGCSSEETRISGRHAMNRATAVDFKEVWNEELAEIRARRQNAKLQPENDTDGASVQKRVGLALSGGGVRSASL